VWDDRVTLGAGTKFAGQALAALVVMIWGDVSISSLTMSERTMLPVWLAQPLTLLFLVGVTNAINLADGLDGLAGGTTLLSLCVLAMLALSTASGFESATAIIVIGAVLGFLRFNTYPARVFMGDGGSQILGFSVAVLSILLTQHEATLSSALPLLLLGLPLIDTLMVMSQRLLERRSPFKADRNHTHHRLLQLGFDHYEAVVTIYLLQAALFVTAWFMRYESDLLIAAVFMAIAALLIGTQQLALHRGWRWRAAPPGTGRVASALGRRLVWLRAPERLPQWALWAIAAAGAMFLAQVALRAPPAAADIRALTAILASVLAVSLLWRVRHDSGGWLEPGVMYVAAALAVYLDVQRADHSTLRIGYQVAIFGVLILAVIVRLRLSTERRFRVTPLDVLVIFVALTVPNLPGTFASPRSLGLGIAQLVTLFYAMETLFAGLGPQTRRWPALGVLAFLLACIIRSAL
jgi:UDP-GlcNAc:undecaprenyl-phosphate GlcNAc-1-phosphate transferase